MVIGRPLSKINQLYIYDKKQLQVANGMYDFFENEDVFWENKTHATDLFGQRTIELIKQKVRLRWYNSSGNVLAKVSLRQ